MEPKGKPPVAPDALKRLTTGAKLNQLGRATGISVSMLAKVFNRKRNPSAKLAKIIAAQLGTTVDNLRFVIQDAGKSR